MLAHFLSLLKCGYFSSSQRYGFRKPPYVELKARPKLGEREVTLVHVTEWIEKKLEQELQVKLSCVSFPTESEPTEGREDLNVSPGESTRAPAWAYYLRNGTG